MKRAVLTGFGVAVAALWPRSAAAQVAVDWQGTATAGIGVTTNVANTPVPAKNAPVGTPYPHWDGFGDVSPGIQLDLESRRTTHVFSYVFDYRYYLLNHNANVVSNTFAYQLGATLSSTVDYAMGLTLAQTQLSAFNIVGAAQGVNLNPTNPALPGNSFLFTGVVNQALHVAASANNVFSEGLAFTANDTIPVRGTAATVAPPYQTYIASGTLGLAHQFRRDTLGGELGTDGLIYPTQHQPNLLVPSHIDIVHRATIDWRHEINPEWSTNLNAGVLVAYEATGPALVTIIDATGSHQVKSSTSPTIQPAVTAGLEYGTERGRAGISYTHLAQPNLITQQLSLADTIALRGGLPLYGSGFDLSGTAAGIATRPLLLDQGGFGNVTYGIVGDAALGYTKPTWLVRFEARYQISRQFPIGHQNPTQLQVLDIRRQNLLFSVTAFFPHPPAAGTHGPSIVGVPSPGSNPDIIGRQEQTRGQMEDKDRTDAHDRREERSKKSDSGGDSSSESK